MAKDWQEYQITVAEFFTSLGCTSSIEAEIEGVRGKHKIDVYATIDIYGLRLKWVIECKHWGTRIPKEKVLTLQSIVQDVGADRGFLLSETGFQSGAVRCAENSNITLSSLEQLSAQAKNQLYEAVFSRRIREVNLLAKKFHLLTHIVKEDSHGGTVAIPPNYTKEYGRVTFLKSSLEKAIEAEFPVVVSDGNAGRLIYDAEALLDYTSKTIDEAQAWYEDNKGWVYSG